jgi:hypothetical protein
MRSPTRVRIAAAAIAVLAVLGLGGAALAHWSAAGTGSGSARTGTATAVTLTPGTPSRTLFPGGRGDVTLVVTNPNTIVVSIGALSLDATQGSDGFSVDAGHAGCAVSSLTYTTQTNGGAGWTVPAAAGGADGTLAVTLPVALAMSDDAANACQGADFAIYLKAGS